MVLRLARRLLQNYREFNFEGKRWRLWGLHPWPMPHRLVFILARQAGQKYWRDKKAKKGGGKKPPLGLEGRKTKRGGGSKNPARQLFFTGCRSQLARW
jgi:hypothetical protein